MVVRRSLFFFSTACLGLFVSAVGKADDPAIMKAAVEVKAKLVEVPGKFPPNELYDYAYVMKYRVLGGAMDGKTILVAHFNPRQPRSEIKAEMKKWVAGTLPRFKQGDTHRLTITPHLEKIWKNAIEDAYEDDRESIRYWCLKADLAD